MGQVGERSAIAERLAELKSRDVPHASLERIQAAPRSPRMEPKRLDSDEAVTWDTLPADLAEVVDAQLSSYAWLLDPVGGYLLCPGCETRGAFAWNDVHGQGNCGHCGWPGMLYHYVLDPDPNAPCRRCGARLDEHGPEAEQRWTAITTGEVSIERYRPCPNSDSTLADYRARDVLRFDLLLWVHPDEVHAR